MWAGINAVKEGVPLNDVSTAIDGYTRSQPRRYGIIRDYGGHGIGSSFHEEPQVPNYGKPKRGPRLMPGMTIAIEPMVNLGGPEIRTLDDRWTVVTQDGSLSAHFEHTVAVLPDGGPPRILTTAD